MEPEDVNGKRFLEPYFNSTKVQFGADFPAVLARGEPISIPLRYNLESNEKVFHYHFLFDFNSTKVQFGGKGA